MALFHTYSARIRALLSSIFCPSRVLTNQNTGLIRLIACISMATDHFGKMLFPGIPEMRMIGRLAFPLFAYGIAAGAVYTRNSLKYLSRIVLLMLVSQPLYAVSLAHENAGMYAIPFFENPIASFWQFYTGSWQKPSILLSLALGLCIMLCLKKRQWILAAGLYIFCVRFSSSLDYGINGIHLMLLFYLLIEHPFFALPVISLYMLHWGTAGFLHIGLQAYAVPAVVFACLPLRGNLRLPRWFIYGFYPAHLLVLAFFVKLPLFFPA